MKTNMKYLISLLAIVSIASCTKLGSGNDNKEDSAGKLVKSIIHELYRDGKFIDVSYSKWDYSYDESGRVIKEIWQDVCKNEYIYGTEQMVKNTTFFEEGDLVSSKYYFNNGSLVKAITEGYDSYGEYYSSYTYSYSSGASKPDIAFFDYGSGDKNMINLIWDANGNLVNIKDGLHGCETRISYTDIENKCNIDFSTQMGFRLLGFYESDIIYDRNAFQSIVSKNLPIKVINIYDNSASIMELSYKFDSDGYPIEIKMEDEAYTRIFTITY